MQFLHLIFLFQEYLVYACPLLSQINFSQIVMSTHKKWCNFDCNCFRVMLIVLLIGIFMTLGLPVIYLYLFMSSLMSFHNIL